VRESGVARRAESPAGDGSKLEAGTDGLAGKIIYPFGVAIDKLGPGLAT
jgi:hypothetical protein